MSEIDFKLIPLQCWDCGCRFAIDEQYIDKLDPLWLVSCPVCERGNNIAHYNAIEYHRQIEGTEKHE